MTRGYLLATFLLLTPLSGAGQEVKNAGASINTEYHEAFSAITPDGLTMFILSNRPGGFCGFDIYEAVLN